MDTPQTKSEKVQLVALIAALTWGKARDEKDKLTLRLAEHPDPENQNHTVWHKAVATRTLAEKLKALDPPLKVGEKLEVDTGYPYQWRYTDKNGVERVNEGINL